MSCKKHGREPGWKVKVQRDSDPPSQNWVET